ncbi:hypothetical protein [Herbiconiux sp. A18JL235]|uniref:Uncharacterized protein n=1 Tax=Herbiconiux sp. A18JL235 TaxID=3152363 RepID=A0AB39BCT4_9MICO
MAQTWCIVSDDGDATRVLAERLLADRHRVAVITRDAAPFALLVNDYADAVLPVEVAHPDLLSLTDAVWSIEESFDTVDVIALVGEPREGGSVDGAAGFFTGSWPEAHVALVAPPARV